MKTFLTSRSAGRTRHLALLLAVVGALVLGLIHVRPAASATASSWTVERMPDKILFHSNRMHDNTVRATVHVALFASGNWEYRVDLHNGARIAKHYRVGGEVKVSGMFLVFQWQSGEKKIDGKRNDEWDTIYGRGHDHRLFERWSQVDMGPLDAHFWLHAAWKNGGSDANNWANCTLHVCDM